MQDQGRYYNGFTSGKDNVPIHKVRHKMNHGGSEPSKIAEIPPANSIALFVGIHAQTQGMDKL